MKYIFPFAQVNKGSRIVIYGASDIGYDYYRQVMSTGYAHITAWLDVNCEMYRMLGLLVDPPETIRKLEFDAVVVAILSETTYISARKYLIETGVDGSRIIWNPNPVAGYDVALRYEDIDTEAEAESAVEMSPSALIDEDRLDVIVRYLYAGEILRGESGGSGEKMYEKMFMAINGAVEPTDHFLFRYFSSYEEKRGIDSFKSSFGKLIYSMKNEGFKRDGFIPLNRNGRMINGSHRCAAALAVGCNAWVRSYPVDGVRIFEHRYGSDWFLEAGFGEDEVKLLTGTLSDIKG